MLVPSKDDVTQSSSKRIKAVEINNWDERENVYDKNSKNNYFRYHVKFKVR